MSKIINSDRANIALANRVAVVTIFVNIALAAIKLAAGIFANSAAMLSDAVHSLSDVFSTLIVIIGVNMAGLKADGQHQYGHERFECVASIILAITLALTGAGIGYGGVMNIATGDYVNNILPGTLAFVAALVSIAVKEWMYWYTRAAAKKIDSGVMMADAWHHRSDALSSVGAFIGVFGARLGFPVLDSVACIVICLFILKTAVSIFMDAINKMVDKSCDKKTEDELAQLVRSQRGVVAIDMIRTRIFGSKMFVDLEVSADENLTLAQSHKIAQNVHDAVEASYPNVKHCMVHMDPAQVKNARADS